MYFKNYITVSLTEKKKKKTILTYTIGRKRKGKLTKNEEISG